jgi:hypothetical protein
MTRSGRSTPSSAAGTRPTPKLRVGQSRGWHCPASNHLPIRPSNWPGSEKRKNQATLGRTRGVSTRWMSGDREGVEGHTSPCVSNRLSNQGGHILKHIFILFLYIPFAPHCDRGRCGTATPSPFASVQTTEKNAHQNLQRTPLWSPGQVSWSFGHEGAPEAQRTVPTESQWTGPVAPGSPARSCGDKRKGPPVGGPLLIRRWRQEPTKPVRAWDAG